MMIRSYSELKRLRSFNERYSYLKLHGTVGEATFGFDRYLNQVLYNSDLWKKSRDEAILRDNGCDLGVEDYEIHSRIIVHHMNPITIEDLELGRDIVYDPEFLICTSHNTHNAIHYGNEDLLPKELVVRKPGDTCLWL